VRAGRADDIAAAVDLFRAAVHGLAARDHSPEQCRAWAPDAIDPMAWQRRWAGRAVWVAVGSGGEPVGFAEVGPDGHLDMSYEHPAAAGQGVASVLLAEAEAAARAAGPRCLRPA